MLLNVDVQPSFFINNLGCDARLFTTRIYRVCLRTGQLFCQSLLMHRTLAQAAQWLLESAVDGQVDANGTTGEAGSIGWLKSAPLKALHPYRCRDPFHTLHVRPMHRPHRS